MSGVVEPVAGGVVIPFPWPGFEACRQCGGVVQQVWVPELGRVERMCPPCCGFVRCPADPKVYPKCPLCKGTQWVEELKG